MFNWAVVGTGKIANTVLTEVVASGRHKVVAVYSRTKAKAQAFADNFGATAYDSLADMLQNKDIQGVYVATPHSAHYSVMLAALEAGIPVLSEKAFTVNAAQAEKLVAISREKGVYCCEAMWTRFNPVIRSVCDKIAAGEIGEVKTVKAAFCTPLMKLPKSTRTERIDNPMLAGGALLDLGVYPVSFAQMILGTPDKIESVMTLNNGVDMREEMTLWFGDKKAVLKSGMDGAARYAAKITGTKGSIYLPMFFRPSTAFVSKKGRFLPEVLRCKAGYIYEFDTVAADISAKRLENEFISHDDTVCVMRILDAIRSQNGFEYPQEIEKV